MVLDDHTSHLSTNVRPLRGPGEGIMAGATNLGPLRGPKFAKGSHLLLRYFFPLKFRRSRLLRFPPLFSAPSAGGTGPFGLGGVCRFSGGRC